MRFVFRSDASPLIGTGHVMRSSAIAEEFIKSGHEVYFVGEIQGINWLSERIRDLGFTKILKSEEDFSPNSLQDVLIIDSYFISVTSKFIHKSNWFKVVSIFDAVSPRYHCDMRIHPGLSSGWDEIPNVKTISGPRYIPIRASLKKLANSSESIPLRILIVGGGTDVNDFGMSLARVLLKLKNDFKVVLLVPNNDEVVMDSRFSIFSFGSSFDEMISGIDLAFTTASTVSLELAANGFAMGIGCAVKNQEIYYSELQNLSMAVPIGKFDSGSWNFNLPLIIEFIESKDLRNKVRTKALDTLDFFGSYRIYKEIMKLMF